jgi:glycosyltransferase involved in cell wall biosynthesis
MSVESRHPPARLAVLIPCFNEELTIADVVADFRRALPSAEVYVFDNNSTDQSVAEARGAGAHVLPETQQGKGYVLQSMFRAVDAEVYVLVDGDRTYSADAVRSLIEPILAGRADMVIGSRLHPQAASEFATLNRWGNRFFVLLLRMLFRISLTDLLSGYRALTRAVARNVILTSGGFQVEAELTIKTIRAGFRVVELPVNLGRRPPGSYSKIRVSRDGLAILTVMVAAFRREEPLKFFSGMASMLLVLGSVVLLVRPRLVQFFLALLLALLGVVIVHATARRP